MSSAPLGVIDREPAVLGTMDQVSELQRFAADLLACDPVDAGFAAITVEIMEVACLELEATLDERTGPASAAAVCELLLRTGTLQTELRKAGVDERFATLRTIRRGLARVRAARTLPELIQLAATEACEACGFDRVVVSQVQGSSWSPCATHESADVSTPGGPDLQEVLALQIPLCLPLPEAELARRGTGTLVTGAVDDVRTDRRFVEALGADAYVVASVTVGGRTVGFLHGCTRDRGRSLTAVDVENAGSFADGLGLAVEALVLTERLEKQRSRVADVFKAAATTATDLPLQMRLPSSRPDAEADLDVGQIMLLDDQLVREAQVQGIFTPKEREVLMQMVGGATNPEIAARLVVCDSTVKSHVKHILRKLKARSRSEAVCRYMRLISQEEPVA